MKEILSISDKTKADIAEFVSSFVKGPHSNSVRTASLTVELLRKIIDTSEWKTATQLISGLKGLDAFGPSPRSPPVVGNILRRVLRLIRDEYSSSLKGRQEEADTQESLHKMLVEKKADLSTELNPDKLEDLKSKILEALDELATEVEAASDEIANQSLEHIHANEVILTIGKSRTVQMFLQNAAKDRKFQVIVAESAPFFHGQEMAASLAKTKNISTTLITDSAVFAMMSRVNKVIIGTNSVMADGGLRAASGVMTAALAAKHYSVPLYVCAAIFKLTPLYVDQGLNDFVSPQESLRGLDGKILSKVDSPTPRFEYVPPDLVTLFVSNISGYAPSYVYRLLGEYYHKHDYEL